MTSAPPTTLVCTVVHCPGSIPESLWNLLRIEAGGAYLHELRLAVEGSGSPSGAQLDDALSAWIHSIEAGHGSQTTVPPAATEPTWVAVLDDTPLKDHTADSSSIHRGMVVVLRPRAQQSQRIRRTASALRLCITTGPDSGWMVRLARGAHVLGRGTAHRGTADIRINDPALEREHASIDVGAADVRLSRTGASPKLLSVDSPIAVGRSRVELVQEPPSPSPWTVWPVPPASVAELAPSGRHRTMLLMSLAPLIVGVVLVLVTGMWIFLLFSAASAAIAVATLVSGRRQRRRFLRAASAAAAVWAQRRRSVLPPPGHAIRVLRARKQPRSATFTIDCGGAVVTVGDAQMEAEWDGPVESGTQAGLPELTVSTATALTLRGSEHTTLSGPPREQLAVLRWILAQLTHHHARAPDILLTAGPGNDDEARLGDLADLVELRDYRGLQVVQADNLPSMLSTWNHRTDTAPAPVLLSPVPLPPAHIRAALDAGWHVISATDPAPAPRLSCRPGSEHTMTTATDGWHLDLESRELHRTESGAARRIAARLIPDGLSRQTLHEHLRLGLRHSSGVTGDADVPEQFSAALPSAVMNRSAHRRLETLLGRGPTHDELLDLVEDGPHILLAGTTGAGKSELLKSMLLGWAARYDPSQLNLLLFDFKGGSSFQHLVRLEHTLGLVTDLTQAQADRALEGIRSELARRESLFLQCGASDYTDFRRSRPDQPLARILVVIDEFRVFTQELPEAMGELMRLATLGRSLGLHLILATQRPQGVVTAEIRANIGTIICLRLRSEDEARELVGTDEPARIPRQLPGRGIIRRPGDSSAPFHAVQLQDSSAPISVRPERAPAPLTQGWREDTPQLVDLLAAHVRSQRVRRPHTVLCPPLPEILRAPVGEEIVLGLVDDPAHQAQRKFLLDLDEGMGTAVLAETGSGGTAALQALVRQLLAHPEEVHVYLLDGDLCLEQFRRHPRVGSWVTTDHPPEAHHLVSQLHRLVGQRRTARVPARVPLVLVISGYPRWHGLSHTAGIGALEHELAVLIGEGAGFGLSAVILGGRELALGKLGSRLACKVYLPYGVAEDVRLLWPKLRATDRLPGRGVLITADEPPPGLSIQLVTGVREQQSERRADDEEEALSPSMLRVHPLPEAVVLPPLEPPPGAVVPGLHQFTHTRAVLHDHAWQVGLILGAEQTGKTNALRVIGAQRCCRTLADLAENAESGAAAAGASRLLLVDDADRCTPAQHRDIEAWLNSGGKVLAAARPAANVFSQLPWAHRARGGAANFVLSPMSRSQGDVFGCSIPLIARFTPGRAAWIGPEGPRIIQWWHHLGEPA